MHILTSHELKNRSYYEGPSIVGKDRQNTGIVPELRHIAGAHLDEEVAGEAVVAFGTQSG
jgi:hypothetical protein